MNPARERRRARLLPRSPGATHPNVLVPDLTAFRASPAVLVFHSAEWNPADRELIATYDRLVRDLPLPVLNGDRSAADQFGVGPDGGLVILDANGDVCWRHLGSAPINAVELDRSVTGGTWTRREFVATVVGVAFALAMAPTLAHAERATAAAAPGNARPVTLNVNGRDITLMLEPRVSLLDALREYAGLTGTKKGCDHGQCGACTVHINGRRSLSCLTFAVMHQRQKITTIEGLVDGEQLHPMQQAFITQDGFQCGYCTSGQIMAAVAVVAEPWGPTDDDVREAMSGNICRCGAYAGIVAAVQQVRGNGRVTK